MKLLYFAWLRTRIGQARGDADAAGEVRDVRALLDWLKAAVARPRRGAHEPRVVRVAVNQEYVQLDHPVARRTTRSRCSRR